MEERERAAQVKLAATGDQDALQRLIVLYEVPLRGVVARRIDASMRRYIDPDDVLQEAYIKAYDALSRPTCDGVSSPTFDGPGGFYKWLEKIALNRLKNQKRHWHQSKRDIDKRVFPRASATASYPSLLSWLPGSQGTPSRQMRKAEASAAVMSSLARLADDQRHAVTMRLFEDVSVSEIAAHLGKSEMAVYRLFHQGLKRLRKHLVSISNYLTRP